MEKTVTSGKLFSEALFSQRSASQKGESASVCLQFRDIREGEFGFPVEKHNCLDMKILQSIPL